MPGRATAMVTVPARSAAKTATARIFRRLQIAAAASGVTARPRCRRAGGRSSRAPIRRDDLVVVEGNPLRGRSVEPEDEDLPARGEGAERAGLGDDVQNGCPTPEVVAARGLDFADHGDLGAPDLSYDDGDLRRGHVLGKLLRHDVTQFHRG